MIFKPASPTSTSHDGISRRAFIDGSVALGVSTLVFTAGSSTGVAARTARSMAGATQTEATRLVFASRLTELADLHPFSARLSRALAVSYHINEGLTKFATDFTIVPGLAESWEISDDNLTYTFTLRPDVTWHDGTPFSSADVLFTLEAARAEDSQSAAKDVMTSFVDSIESPDESTVVITMSKPYSALLSVLAGQLQIVPEHLLSADVYDAGFTAAPVGTGPYRFDSAETGAVTLVSNPEYWGEAAKIGTIILRDSPEVAAQQAGFLAGELDVISFVPTVMAGLEAQGFPIFRGTGGSVHCINLDLQNPIMQDRAVREALRLGLDRARIKDLHYTNGQLADAAVSPAYEGYSADVPATERDLDGANQLLDDAGWTRESDSGTRAKDGQELAFRHYAWQSQQWQDIAAIAQANWAEIGVAVEIVSVENALIADTLSGQFDAAPLGWGLTNDPLVGLDLLFRTSDDTFASGGTFNVFRYSNPDVDELLAQSMATADLAERQEIAVRVQEQVYEDVPFIPIAYPAYELACQEGVTLDESGDGGLSSIGVGFFMDRWNVS